MIRRGVEGSCDAAMNARSGGWDVANVGRGVGAAVDYLVRKTNRHRRRNETDGNKRAAGSAIVVRGRARARVFVCA